MANRPLFDIGEGPQTPDNSGVADSNMHIWTESILPFIDQTPLYNKINFNVAMSFGTATGGPPPNHAGGAPYGQSQDFAAISSSVIPAYICPSVPRGSNVNAPYKDDWLSDLSPDCYHAGGALDYVGMAPGGIVNDDYGAQGNFTIGAILDIETGPRGFNKNSGGVRISKITDGTSNTLICGERSAPDHGEWFNGKKIGNDSDEAVGFMGDSWNDWQHATGHFFRGVLPTDNRLAVGAPHNGDCTINCGNVWGWYSFHTGGAHFVMADGTVRFISQNIDRLQMSRLYCFGDGGVLGEF